MVPPEIYELPIVYPMRLAPKSEWRVPLTTRPVSTRYVHFRIDSLEPWLILQFMFCSKDRAILSVLVILARGRPRPDRLHFATEAGQGHRIRQARSPSFVSAIRQRP